MKICTFLIATAISAASMVAVGAGTAQAAEDCAPGAIVTARYNRPLPCNPNRTNILNYTWGKNWGARHVQELCAAMGGEYRVGERLRWCLDVDF